MAQRFNLSILPQLISYADVVLIVLQRLLAFKNSQIPPHLYGLHLPAFVM
jgi:hypothetical protein